MARYTESALKTGLTDAVEIADQFEAELASRGCSLVEVTRAEVVNGKIWFRIVVSWNDTMDNGTQLDRLARIDELGQVRMEMPLLNAYTQGQPLELKVNDKVQFWIDETPMTGIILFAVGTNGAAVELESGAEMFIDLSTVTRVL